MTRRFFVSLIIDEDRLYDALERLEPLNVANVEVRAVAAQERPSQRSKPKRRRQGEAYQNLKVALSNYFAQSETITRGALEPMITEAGYASGSLGTASAALFKQNILKRLERGKYAAGRGLKL